MSWWIVDIPYTAHKVTRAQPLPEYFHCELANEGCRGVQLTRAVKPGLKEKIMDGGEQTVDDHSAKWTFVYDLGTKTLESPPRHVRRTVGGRSENGTLAQQVRVAGKSLYKLLLDHKLIRKDEITNTTFVECLNIDIDDLFILSFHQISRAHVQVGLGYLSRMQPPPSSRFTLHRMPAPNGDLASPVEYLDTHVTSITYLPRLVFESASLPSSAPSLAIANHQVSNQYPMVEDHPPTSPTFETSSVSSPPSFLDRSSAAPGQIQTPILALGADFVNRVAGVLSDQGHLEQGAQPGPFNDGLTRMPVAVDTPVDGPGQTFETFGSSQVVDVAEHQICSPGYDASIEGPHSPQLPAHPSYNPPLYPSYFFASYPFYPAIPSTQNDVFFTTPRQLQPAATNPGNNEPVNYGCGESSDSTRNVPNEDLANFWDSFWDSLPPSMFL